MIHLLQLLLCNEAYAPRPQQMEWSRRVVKAFEEGTA
jgi:citrate lyase beta subunit